MSSSRLAASAALLLFVLAPTGFAATIKVPQHHATINAAIAAANQGDVIEIAKGTYAENVLVDVSGITLVGKGKVVIDPGGAGAGIRVVGVTDVVLRKLQVQNTSLDGIFLDFAFNCRVEDCRVTDTTTNAFIKNDVITSNLP